MVKEPGSVQTGSQMKDAHINWIDPSCLRPVNYGSTFDTAKLNGFN